MMPDLADLNDVIDDTPPHVTVGGSESGKLHPICSLETGAEYRRFKNCFPVLTDGVEPSLQLHPSITVILFSINGTLMPKVQEPLPYLGELSLAIVAPNRGQYN
ncbi:unnamed protein product [Dibothriocephalus latus]|uniref:Uncharacterized protein n=1 Tax=Dibothriocephalus latus TaxID=60516 RepID=A0A3P7P3W1_DIBLA|nr:unnamed protein product [Dibothriocephalus latus]